MYNTSVLVIIGAVLLIMSMSSRINTLQKDIAHMNLTLNKIAKQLGVSTIITENINNELKYELKDLISEGKKIKAIKKYRIATGVGLKEAKEYIDSLSNQNLNK